MRSKKYSGVYPRVLAVLEQPVTGPGNVTVLTQDVLAQYLSLNPRCRCTLPQNGGLRAGMSLYQVKKVHGCCEGWVCTCLDAIRRRMGH